VLHLATRTAWVEWFALLFRIQDVPRSNLSLETGYPDLKFSWASSIAPGKCQEIRPRPLSSISFLIPHQPTIRRHIILRYWQTSQNKLKLKLSHYSPWRRLGERRYSSYSFFTSALDGGEWSASRPGRALAPGKELPVPSEQEAGWTL
jgi:hypothetical protein